MLSIKKLSIYLVNDLRTVIDDFSFSLERGMKACIIGEEGNGKSSILKAIVDDEGLKEYAEISGEITVRPIMKLSITVDHRVVDGQAAAKFLNTVKKYLENTISILG